MAPSDAAAAIRSEPGAERQAAVEMDALARGLLLMRASTTSIVRLQLAMERCDRRVAIESLDDLMLLDRRIGDLVGTLETDGLSADFEALDHRQRALAVERLVLAAGTKGPNLTPLSDQWIEQAPITLDVARRTEAVPGCIEPDAAEEPRRNHFGIALILLIAAAILFGTAAFLLLTDAGRGLIGGLTAWNGVF